MSSIPHHHNQLLFNLEKPVESANMAVKFHRPEPIVVEKFGPTLTPMSTPLKSHPSIPAFQFSAVSQDRLSVALQLARRDLKQQKVDEETKKNQGKKDGKRKTQNIGGRSVYSKGASNVTSKKGVDKKVSAFGRSHTKDRQPQNAPIRVSSRKDKPTQMILHMGRNNTSLPARGMSPPTRDIDPDPYLLPRNSIDQKSLAEIKHLREEINKCLDQILKIEETAQKGDIPKRRLPGEEDLPDSEVARRRAHRAEEQANRSGRLVYNLQQQVKSIQQELDKLRPGIVKAEKKSQLLSRLAAAHRGAIRALQAFVTQLEDHDWRKGLPKTHQELTLLVRQLSLCCAQLEVAGQDSVPDSVRNLIKDMADYNVALEKEFHSSPPRCTKSAPLVHHQHSTPPRRNLLADDSRRETRIKKSPLRKEVLTGVSINEDNDKENFSNNGVKLGGNKKDGIQLKGEVSSPEREQVLRQGIAALIRAAEKSKETSESKLGNRKKMQRYSRADGNMNHRRGTKKSVILPVNVKARRSKTSLNPQFYSREGHFAQATVSSRLKEVPPHERPVTKSPARGASLSPRRGDFKSPCSKYSRSLSPSPVRSPRSPRYAQKEIERQVWLDREASRKLRELDLLKSRQTQEIEKLRNKRTEPNYLVADAEKRIREKIQPLLEKAQDIVEKYEAATGASGATNRAVPQHLSNNVEMNADVLSEMILEDITKEVADDIGLLADDGELEREARLMQNAQSVEGIMQRLHEMENEQHEIRRRYATISYEDELPGTTSRTNRTVFFDTDGQDRPTTPPPIQVDKTQQQDNSYSPKAFLRTVHRPVEDEGAILFTKSERKVRNFSLPQEREQSSHQRERQTEINLSNEIISNIFNNKERYSKFLKRTSTQAVGRFNPWQVVEQVSDEILEECLTDIGKELEAINNDIVSHVYHAEFKDVKTTPEIEANSHEES